MLAAWRRPLIVALSLTVVLRVITTFIALNAAYGTAFPHVVAHIPSVLVEVWAHWDTGYYLAIAQHGYPASTAVQIRTGLVPKFAAFGPVYPWLVWLVRTAGHLGWITSTQFVSAVAMVIAIAGLVHLLDQDDYQTTNAAVTLLVAFPTAFFLLAGYPDSLALMFVIWAFVAARHGRWVLAGLAAAGAAMTVFYLGVVVFALLFEVWGARTEGKSWPDGWERDGMRAVAVSVPTAVSFVGWMAVCDRLYSDPLAFVRVQGEWGRHFAFPWTLARGTFNIFVHLRFLTTSTASIMELFDSVTVVTLAVVTVAVFLKVRRSYGVLLGISLCLFVFQTILYSETREVLVLFPFFIGLARWVTGHPWRERFLLALFLPSAYFLVSRFVTGAFAG